MADAERGELDNKCVGRRSLVGGVLNLVDAFLREGRRNRDICLCRHRVGLREVGLNTVKLQAFQIVQVLACNDEVLARLALRDGGRETNISTIIDSRDDRGACIFLAVIGCIVVDFCILLATCQTE